MKQPMHLLAAAALLLGSAHAAAQSFPAKPIRFVVGLAPGGGTDIVARMVAAKMSSNTSQQVLIDNKPGAGGNIAGEYVAKSPADGYTLVVVTASHAVNPSMYKDLSHPVRDFTPLTQLTSQAYVFVVHASLPARTVKEFIAYANGRKGNVTYASSGSGLLGHLGMELLKLQGGFEAVHAPYKGAGPALADVLGGRVEAFFPTIISGSPHVKSGKLRALAVTTLNRAATLPDVPTVAEQGFPGYEVNGWYGILGPAGIPRDVTAVLHRELVKVLRSPDIKDKLAADGAEAVGNTPEQFGAYIGTEMTKWAEVVRKSGATAD